jgi:peptidoglycan/LPS O-acetylase OafA/YrhL
MGGDDRGRYKKDPAIFPGLDALRGYAAIAVVLFHSAVIIKPGGILPSGYLAVDLFFLMSGFVVAHAYEKKVPSLGVLGFLRIRVIRFYPLFLAGGILGLIKALATVHSLDGIPMAVAAYLLFLPSPSTAFSEELLAPLNAPAWSLMIELYVNILWAFLLPKLQTKHLVAVVLFSAACCLATLAHGISLNSGSHLYDFGIGLARVMYSFPLGLLLYRFKKLLPNYKVHPAILIIACLIAFSVPASQLWSVIFIFLVSPTLVVAALLSGNSDGISRYGAAGSYCIYSLHMPGIGISYGVANRLGIDPRLGTVIWVAGLLVAAPLIDRWFDRPFRSFLSRRWRMNHIPGLH